MKKLAFLLVSIVLLAACGNKDQSHIQLFPNSLEPTENEELAKGVVFHDKNENRFLDAN